MGKSILTLLLGLLIGAGTVAGVWRLRAARPAPAHDEHGEDDGHGHGGEKKPHEDEGQVRLTDAARKAAGLRNTPVEKKKIGSVLTAAGIVRPNADRVAHISSKVGGRVAEIHVFQGAKVKAGTPLLTLDSLQVGEAAVDLLKARSSVDISKVNFDREEELLKKNATRGVDHVEAKNQYLRAQADVRSARQRLLLLGWAPERVDKLSWDDTALMSRITIVSPIDGEVIRKHASVGEVIQPETNLYTIADLSTVWVELSLFQKDIRQVHREQPVETICEGHAGKIFLGKVTYVGSSVAEETRTFTVRVVLDNPEGHLRPGMYVTSHLRDDEDEHAKERLLVPISALTTLDNAPTVFVSRAPGVYERRAVTPGQVFGTLQEILAGLKEGEDVVTEGTFILKSELLRSEMSHEH